MPSVCPNTRGTTRSHVGSYQPRPNALCRTSEATLRLTTKAAKLSGPEITIP
jgi:hypothetical protein